MNQMNYHVLPPEQWRKCKIQVRLSIKMFASFCFYWSHFSGDQIDTIYASSASAIKKIQMSTFLT